jgi:thiamine pyrophosphokinase
MSSHHIVKDNQEPALIFANGADCSDALLQQLMEWSPYVLALDGAVHRLLDRKIRFDAWLGDFDSSAGIDEAGMASMGPIERVYAEDQDKTDLHKGIEFLISKGHKAANVVWATGRRADHTFNNLATLWRYHDQITVSILDDHSRVYPMSRQFKKWYPTGTQLSLIPVGIAHGIVSKNLKFPLENLTLELPHSTGSSNEVAADGFVEITYESGHLLMMECFD